MFRVNNVTSNSVPQDYREGESQILSLSPLNGFRFLRVKAKIVNVTQSSDVPYALWAFDGGKRMARRLSAIFGSNAEPSQAERWLDDSLIFLLGEQDLITVAHVCEGSALRGLGTLTVTSRDGKPKVITAPQILAQGSSATVDLLFTVPAQSRKYRLLVLGAAPVELPGLRQ